MNLELLQADIDKVTPRLFEEAIFNAFYEGLETIRPLGYSGPTFLLFGESRKSEVSVRNWSGLASMLITDSKGGFLFSGHLPLGLGLEVVAQQFYDLLQLSRPHLLGIVPSVEITPRPGAATLNR